MYSNVQYLVFNFTPDSQCECEFLHRVFFFSFFKIILMLHLLTYEPNTCFPTSREVMLLHYVPGNKQKKMQTG